MRGGELKYWLYSEVGSKEASVKCTDEEVNTTLVAVEECRVECKSCLEASKLRQQRFYRVVGEWLLECAF